MSWCPGTRSSTVCSDLHSPLHEDLPDAMLSVSTTTTTNDDMSTTTSNNVPTTTTTSNGLPAFMCPYLLP
jgi:hypothetical protein